MNFVKSGLSMAIALIVSGGSSELLAANFALEEVIVTATKTAETQQTVPLSVTAFTGNTMAQKGITETTQLTGLVPSLVVSSPYGRSQPNFALRGVSVANEFNANAASPIGVYVNEDYKQFRPTHGMQLFDIERLEVIRGPQGTLFGRNTTGGAISVETVKPEIGEVGEFTGFVTGKYGNYDRWSVTAATETTLIDDKLAVRLAVTENQGDGYLKNKTPAQVQSMTDLLLGLPASKDVNAVSSEDMSSVDDRAARLTFVYTPSENVDVTFIATTGESEPYGPAPIVSEFGQPDAAGNYTDAFGYNRAQFGLDDEDEIVTDGNGKYKTSADDFVLTMNWYLSDDITLTSITGYLEGDYEITNDCDGTPTRTCFYHPYSEFDQLNQDFRFAWVGERSTFIAGIYYGEDEVSTVSEQTFFGPTEDLAGIPQATFAALGGSIPAAQAISDALVDAGLTAFPAFNPPVLSYMALGGFVGDPALLATGFSINSSFQQNRESQAIYMEGAHDVTDELRLTLGLRYTEDDFTLSDSRSTFYDLGGNPQYNAIPLSATPDTSLTLDDLEDGSEEVTGRFIVDYQFSHTMMTYLSYSRGYRAGTFNGLASQDVSQITFVNPEFIDNYEIGVKSRFFDERLQFNASLFLSDYKDQQIQEVIGATTFLRNASSEIAGLEIEVEAVVTPDLFVSLSAGYLSTEYDDNQIIGGVDIGGNEVPFAPEKTANLSINWTIMSFDAGDLELSSSVKYQGHTWFDPFNDDKTNLNGPGKSTQSQGAYTLVDARLLFSAENFDVALWGKNLTDKYYKISGFDTSAFQFDHAIRGEPRMYGVEASYYF